MAARRLRLQRLAGVDPSELMVATAQRRLRGYRRRLSLDLRHGDDTTLASMTGPFDAIVATHSFQFWSDPVATLARIRALLAREGVLVLVLRSRISERVGPWIANPITRSGNERGGVRAALAEAGFRLVHDETLKTGSFGIVAARS